MKYLLIVIILSSPVKRDQIEGIESLSRCQPMASEITGMRNNDPGRFVFEGRNTIAICKPVVLEESK